MKTETNSPTEPRQQVDGATDLTIAAGGSPLLSTHRTMLQTLVLNGSLVLGLGSLTLYALGGLLAEPAARASSAPLWNVEITSASRSSLVALAYSRETGIHFLRVPGAGSRNGARVVPARLEGDELHVVSLGLAGLRAHARGPAGVALRSWSAEGRVITAYQRVGGAGVRTSW